MICDQKGQSVLLFLGVLYAKKEKIVGSCERSNKDKTLQYQDRAELFGMDKEVYTLS